MRVPCTRGNIYRLFARISLITSPCEKPISVPQPHSILATDAYGAGIFRPPEVIEFVDAELLALIILCLQRLYKP